jgi:hypothetical protein
MEDKVRCVDCGFLAVRDEYNDDVCEAVHFTRNRSLHKSSSGNSVRATVFCYRNSSQFPKNAATGNETQIYDAIRLEIDCDEYRLWRPGKTPKEHEEMTMLEKMESMHSQWRIEDLSDRKVTRTLAVLALLVSVASAVICGLLSSKSTVVVVPPVQTAKP